MTSSTNILASVALTGALLLGHRYFFSSPAASTDVQLPSASKSSKKKKKKPANKGSTPLTTDTSRPETPVTANAPSVVEKALPEVPPAPVDKQPAPVDKQSITQPAVSKKASKAKRKAGEVTPKENGASTPVTSVPAVQAAPAPAPAPASIAQPGNLILEGQS